MFSPADLNPILILASFSSQVVTSEVMKTGVALEAWTWEIYTEYSHGELKRGKNFWVAKDEKTLQSALIFLTLKLLTCKIQIQRETRKKKKPALF